MGEAKKSHAIARRGLNALMIKAIGRVSTKQSDDDEKRPSLKRVPSVSIDLNNLQGIVKSLGRVHCFPVRIKLALSRPITSDFATNVYTYACSTAFSILTRNTSDWAKHFPLLYHSQKAVLGSDEIGQAVLKTSMLVFTKIEKNISNFEDSCSVIAELFLQLFLVSVVSDESNWSDEEKADPGRAAAPLCQLMWLAECIHAIYEKMSRRLIVLIDDQFTTRISPYRGVKLSRPVSSALDSILSETLQSFLGIPTSFPSDETSDGLLRVVQFDDFAKEYAIGVYVVRIMERVSQAALGLIRNFNSRHQKAATGMDKLNKLLTRPWSDDVEIRSIVSVYSELARILRERTDMAPLFATVMGGAWRAVGENVSMGQPTETERIIEFPHCPTDLNPDWWRMNASLSGLFVTFVAEQSDYMRTSSITKLQAWWRGTGQRRCRKNLETICVFIQNTGWPEYVLDLDEEEGAVVVPPRNSTLTRASLMRLAPAAKPSERPITPASTSITKHSVNASIVNETSPVPDLIQADHIACAKLFFMMVHCAYLFRLRHRYFSAIIGCFNDVSKHFASLLDKSPQYQLAHDTASSNLKQRALVKPRNVFAKASKVQPSVTSALKKISDEIRDEFLTKSLVLKPKKLTVPSKAAAPIPQQPIENSKLPASSLSLDERFTTAYLKFFDGDDSLLRDISPNCCECMVVPASSTTDMSLIWLPIKTKRFAIARARLFALIRGETAKSIFTRAESDGDFAKCISLLSETEHGSLNVLSGIPISTQPFWTEYVYHLLVGYVAQSTRHDRIEKGLALVNQVISSMGRTLERHGLFHKKVIEAMVFDAAIGFAYNAPHISGTQVGGWYRAASDRHREVGHPFRLSKCSLRYSCVLCRLKIYPEARAVMTEAIEALSKIEMNSLLHVLKINRSILRSLNGELEAAEVEMREVVKISRSNTSLKGVTEVAEMYKNRMVESRNHGPNDHM